MKTRTIIAFAGPSGAGKSELVKSLRESYPDNIIKWQQFTTRPRRGPGDDYVFLTKQGYEKVRDTLTCRTQFGGNFYGTVPEVTPENTAVLTIADIEGIQDLHADVQAHNTSVRVGAPGKFGAEPVELLCVLMSYDVTEAEVARRGRSSRGVNFASNELAQLRHAFSGRWDVEIDTTSKWADPTAFFDEYVWPRIAAADPMEEFGKAVEELVQGVKSIPSIAPEATKVLRDLLSEVVAARDAADKIADAVKQAAEKYVGQPNSPEVQASIADDVGEALETVVEKRHRGIGEERPSDDDEALAIVGDSADAVVEPPVEQSPETVHVQEDEAEVQRPYPDEPEAAQSEPALPSAPEVVAAPAKPATATALMASRPFTEWLAENGTGLTATASREAFERSFATYMLEIGARADDLKTEYSQDKDSKGGVVAVFNVSQDSSGFSGTFRFNRRLRQFV